MNILLVSHDKMLGDALRYIFETEDINLIHETTSIASIDIINKNDIMLIITSCCVKSIEDVILESKKSDLFRPIISICNSKELSIELLSMGVHAVHREPAKLTELSTQALNLFTLYQAKRYSKNQNDVLKTLSLALEVRDPYTHGHGERVSSYAVMLYDALGFKDYEEREVLRTGCLIHDVGKIGTPDSILKSSGRLSVDEYEEVKKHTIHGVEICRNIISDPKVLNIIEHHHEKLDGSGYPHGLKGDEINYLAQVAAIADMYDALTSDRSYRVKNTKDEAFGIIEDHFVGKNLINDEYYITFKNLMLKDKFVQLDYI